MNGATSRLTERQSWFLLGMIVVLTVGFITAGLGLGAKLMPPRAVFSALVWPDGKIDSIFVWKLRLPRSLVAYGAGCGLGVAGLLLQTLTRNPLSGPGITGVTSGAVAAIVSCITFFPAVSSVFHPLIGLAGGMCAALITFWIAEGSNDRTLRLVLGGMTVSLFLSAVTTYLLLRSGPQAPSLLFWISGGFQGRSWLHFLYVFPWVVVGIGGAILLHRVLDMFLLSDRAAAAMGVDLGFWRPVLLILAVLPVAGVVPVAGPISFVGLATPHIVRLLRPKGMIWTIVLTAVTGGLIVALADIVARTIAAPRELPASIITGLIGGPLFIALIYRQQMLPGTARS